MVDFKNYDGHRLDNKLLQYTYGLISQEVKTTTIKFGQLIEYNMRKITHKMW